MRLFARDVAKSLDTEGYGIPELLYLNGSWMLVIKMSRSEDK